MRVCVIFSRFGPYHLARLRAAAAMLSDLGGRLFGLEVASSNRTHYWEPESPSDVFEQVTLSRNLDYQDLGRSAISRLVWKALNDCKPDVVAVNGWAAAEAQIALIWAFRNRRTRILMSTSQHHDYHRRWWREAAKSLALALADSALVGGESHREYLGRLGLAPARVALGYNAVDNDYFSNAIQTLKPKEQRLREKCGLPRRFFFAPCRLIPEKNLFGLLRAYRNYLDRALTQEEAWDLVIAGEGPLRGEIIEMASRLECRSHVHLRPFAQYMALPELYCLAGALILPSFKDTWGLVVNEAMACGLPIIASRAAGATRHLVRENNGCVIDPDSEESIAEAMTQIARKSEVELTHMGAASMAIIKDWGPRRFAEGLIEAIQLARKAS